MSQALIDRITWAPGLYNRKDELKIIAEGVVLGPLREAVLVFFDETVIEPTKGCSSVETITGGQDEFYNLANSEGQNHWSSYEEATHVAKANLQRKDSEPIKWL